MTDTRLWGKKVWVAGHRGLVGSALLRRLQRESCQVLTVTSENVDLRRQHPTEDWMAREKPDIVFVAAARVGGIGANSAYPARFLYDNLMIAANIMHASYLSGVEKLIFLGSTCIYPRDAAQPIKESALLCGPLEVTNEPYALAKIAGIKLAQAYRREYGCNFISVQPTNLFGPGDNFNLENSHVLPALIRKAHDAKLAGAPIMTVWGTGRPLREFLHVDDLADALVFLAKNYDEGDPINVGSGEELSIAALAELVCSVVGFTGRLEFDPSRPDGTPRKLADISRLRSQGWRSRISLREGIESTYRWYLDHGFSGEFANSSQDVLAG